jgi:hypothetical protein
VAVRPCIATSGDEEPHVDLDVEEDESGEGEDAKEHSSCHVHVVLDVDRVIPEKF